MWANCFLLAFTWLLITLGQAMMLKGPAWVPLTAVGVVLLLVLYSLLQRRTHFSPLEPTLHKRLTSVCAEAGHPNLPPATAQSLLSPRACELLSDPELKALLIYRLQPNPRRVFWHVGPWNLLLIVGLLLTWVYREPYLGSLYPFCLVSLQLALGSVVVHRWWVTPALSSALRAGADPTMLAEALLKVYRPIQANPVVPSGAFALMRGELDALIRLSRSAGTDLSHMAASVELKQSVFKPSLRYRSLTVITLMALGLLHLALLIRWWLQP
jgi:hypothetical protein